MGLCSLHTLPTKCAEERPARCLFSRFDVAWPQVLRACDVEFETYDVLTNPGVRDGVKVRSKSGRYRGFGFDFFCSRI